MPPEPSSPDPLQDLDGPSIYGVTPAPRTVRRTSSTAISPRKNRKLSHTTVVSTPTRSPWRIRVVVEAERDEEQEESVPAKRPRTSRTKTTRVPLRGLSPSPLVASAEDKEVVAAQRRKATPARRRRRSTTATPGGPGKTPAKKTRARKSATPLLEEGNIDIDIDEGIGSMMDGMGVLEEEEGPNDAGLVPMVVVETRPKAKSSPRKTPSKTPRKTPRKTPVKKPPTVASSSKAPPPPLEPEDDLRRALSPVNSNRMLSPTPSPRKRRSPSKASQPPPPRPSLMDLGPSSNDDDMEGFSMVDTGSLLPDFLNSLSQHQDQSAVQDDEDDEDEDEDELPDFTFMSGGTSYSPHTKKQGPPTAEQDELFEDDPVGAETFYGADAGAGGFRSSPPPAVFQRLAGGNRAKATPLLKPLDGALQLPPPPPPNEQPPQASSSKKRKRDTPDLDSTLLASEGLRSSIGIAGVPRTGRRMSMSMTSERFGGELDGDELLDDGGEYDDGVEDDDDDDDTDVEALSLKPAASKNNPSPSKTDTKGKAKEATPQSRTTTASLSHTHPAQLAPPRAAFATEEEETLWAERSPEKSVRFLGHEDSRNSPSSYSSSSASARGERARLLEASWAAERAAVSAKAREVGTLTINDDEIEEDSVEAERIVEDIWQAEAEPRSEATPPKQKRGGTHKRLQEEEEKGERTLRLEREWREEREEVKRRALEVGALMIHDTVEVGSEEEEGEGEGEEEGDSYGAAPGGTTTLLNQDTAAFEESLFQREQQQQGPPTGANLFTSSSTPYKRGSSLSDSQITASSKSSPPPTSTKAAASRWRGARGTKATAATASASTSMAPPAKVAKVATSTATTTTTTTAKAPAPTTAKERREARAKQRAEAAAAAAAATQAPPAPAAEEISEEGSANMLPDDLLTPPLSFTTPAAAVARTQVATPPTTNTTASTLPGDSPPPIGPAWEKRHWRLLERLLNSSRTVPPAGGSRLTYSVSIDDPAALDSDSDALLADPELRVATMEGGEKALVLGGSEVEAVRRFRERMRAEGSEREQWGVEEVAAKVGALVLAGVRRRRRAEREEREREEKEREISRGKGKGKERVRDGGSADRRKIADKGKAVERAVDKVVDKVVDKEKEKKKERIEGRAERMAERMKERAERRRRDEGARIGSKLSDWL